MCVAMRWLDPSQSEHSLSSEAFEHVTMPLENFNELEESQFNSLLDQVRNDLEQAQAYLERLEARLNRLKNVTDSFEETHTQMDDDYDDDDDTFEDVHEQFWLRDIRHTDELITALRFPLVMNDSDDDSVLEMASTSVEINQDSSKYHNGNINSPIEMGVIDTSLNLGENRETSLDEQVDYDVDMTMSLDDSETKKFQFDSSLEPVHNQYEAQCVVKEKIGANQKWNSQDKSETLLKRFKYGTDSSSEHSNTFVNNDFHDVLQDFDEKQRQLKDSRLNDKHSESGIASTSKQTNSKSAYELYVIDASINSGKKGVTSEILYAQLDCETNHNHNENKHQDMVKLIDNTQSTIGINLDEYQVQSDLQKKKLKLKPKRLQRTSRKITKSTN